MANFDIKTLRPTKGKAKDPYRYPNVSEVIENKAKDLFRLQTNKMIADITKKMTSLIKK